jgi:hypothetical protein
MLSVPEITGALYLEVLKLNFVVSKNSENNVNVAN